MGGVPSPHYRDRTNTPKSLRPSLLDSSIFGLSRMPKFMALRLLDLEIFNFQKCLLKVVYLYISIYIYITQTPHKLNMENSITQVLLNGSMPNFAEVLYTVRTLFTQTLVEFGPIGQFLLGSLFSKWDLKVGISVSWQGFFIFMLRIRVGGLPCGLARPLMTQYFNLLEAMLDMGSKTRTSVSRTEHSSHHLFARMS